MGLPGRLRRRLRALRGPAPVVLMYHRVARPALDPWGICVAPERFEEQVAMLAAQFAPIAMDDLVGALAQGRVARRSIALTFDDGYADNALVARPILARHGVPATLFLASAAIGSGQRYWWDELADMVLLSPNAVSFSVEAGGATLAGAWGAQPDAARALAGWRVGEESKNGRASAYLSLWQSLQALLPAEREQAMAALRGVLDAPVPSAADLPMDRAMARTAAGGITRLGGHARTHAPLPRLPVDEQRAEIAGGRADVAALSGGTPPTGFAYPHGEFDTETKRLVREAGYAWAVGSRSDAIDPRRYDRFELPRIVVGDWSADRLHRALRGLAG